MGFFTRIKRPHELAGRLLAIRYGCSPRVAEEVLVASKGDERVAAIAIDVSLSCGRCLSPQQAARLIRKLARTTINTTGTKHGR